MSDVRITADGLFLASEFIGRRARGLRMELENEELACRLMDELEADSAALRRVALFVQSLEIGETTF
jgi:hypothetical protein